MTEKTISCITEVDRDSIPVQSCAQNSSVIKKQGPEFKI